jgi:hypothetical protein
MDYYHFVKGATVAFHDNAQRLRGRGPVHFETPLVGPWDALTIINDTDLETAYELISELNSPSQSPSSAEDRPLASTTAVETVRGTRRIRRSYHEEYEAYALITTATTPDDELFASLEELDGYAGSAMVDGIFDILVLIGGATPEQLRERLARLRAAIRGRARAQVCYQPPLPEGASGA